MHFLTKFYCLSIFSIQCCGVILLVQVVSPALCYGALCSLCCGPSQLAPDLLILKFELKEKEFVFISKWNLFYMLYLGAVFSLPLIGCSNSG